MNLSAGELEEIKQSHKVKDLQEIIKEEADKKDDNEDTCFADAEGGEGGDQNFISDMVENQAISEADSKRESVYQKLKDELGNVVVKLRKAVRPVSTEIRSLDNEVGGLEVDYQKIKKTINESADVWDDRTKKIAQGAEEADQQDMEENESFIHGIKAGIFGKRRGKKRKHLGQVDLGKAAEGDDAPPVGFVGKLSQLREDRSQTKNTGQGGGIGF